MKKISLLLCLFITCAAIAQKTVKDTLPTKMEAVRTIPNALSYKKYHEKFAGNNGQGFDIYTNSVDNMAVLKPDNNFKSNMPGATKPLDQMRALAFKHQKPTDTPALPNPLFPHKKKAKPFYKLPQTDALHMPLLP